MYEYMYLLKLLQLLLLGLLLLISNLSCNIVIMRLVLAMLKPFKNKQFIHCRKFKKI